MMRIKQLPPHEAHKIAAGEVVDRPANVVKELVENAIDAGATQIVVYIENAGQKTIRIVDNGCGMSPDDARLSIAQYATSKITSIDDLAHLHTFGFRGEALASITAVSKTTLITKEQESNLGISLTIENGAIVSESSISCNTGTDITISDLFYNVPARKKFLKKEETEWRTIVQLAHAFCLSYITIGFKFFHNDKLIINCPAVTTLTDRAAQLWERAISQNIISLISPHDTKNNIHITGLISNHHYYRYDRQHVFFFVNNRWVKNYALGSALLKGYLNAIPPQRSPLAALFITVNQADIDVNIHPRKEEVQFLHPRIVEVLLQKAVKETLENHLSSQITKSTRPEFATSPFPSSVISEFPTHPFPTDLAFSTQPTFPGHQKSPVFAAPLAFSQPTPPAFPTHNPFPVRPEYFSDSPKNVSKGADISNIPLETKTDQSYQLIGQYKKTYLLLEHEDGLFLIDQHAAHERILYELFAQKFNDIATISLLFPQIINLSDDDILTIIAHLDLFNQNGILVEQFGANQLVIQAIPVYLKNIACDDLIKNVISWIKEERTINQADMHHALLQKIRAQMACKAAVKAGDELTTEQMHQLLRDLDKTDNRFTCPHGRPTGWLLSLHEIEKKFKRKT